MLTMRTKSEQTGFSAMFVSTLSADDLFMQLFLNVTEFTST